MAAQLTNIFIWAFVWTTSWAIFMLFFRKKADYIHHFLLTVCFFLTVTVVISLTFKEYLIRAFGDFSIVPFIVLGAVIIIHVFLYIYIPRHLKEPTDYFLKYPKRQYFRLHWKRLISKSVDILSQQVFVLLLVMFLKDAGLSLYQIIFAFALFFGLVHAPLIFIVRDWTSWYFTIFSFLSAIVFPILIIKVHYGFVYSFIVHWIFYTLTAVVFWLWYNYTNRMSDRVV